MVLSTRLSSDWKPRVSMGVGASAMSPRTLPTVCVMNCACAQTESPDCVRHELRMRQTTRGPHEAACSLQRQ